MEPNRFEESIKEKLEDRRLQPSNDAWNKLSERLETQHNKKNNKTIWWLGIAASVIGILFVAVQFFNKTEDIVVPVIVNSPTVIEKTEKTQVAVEEPNTILEVTSSTEKKDEFQLSENSKTPIKKDKIVIAEEQAISQKENQTDTSVKISQENLSFEAQKIKDVVAKVELLKEQNQEVSDDVVNALLLEAQKEIRLKKFHNNTTGVVDANMLLEEVETDLDQSFRSKVFDAIKASYNTVKTTVAQRNN